MKILIVEDEQKLAEALAEGLSKKGYTTDILHDGDKAHTRISLHRDDYDLIILDLMLPGMDGATICKKAREGGVDVPILILTARNETETRIDLLLSGADDYLMKPFSFEELCARVHALLRRPSSVVPDILVVRDIRLDPVLRTVHRDNKEISLTLKEFCLLEHFMRHPDEVINREDLLSHLWDFNYSGFSNVVDVHVKNLRKKLEHGASPILLETVRGIGYRLRK